MTKEEIAGLENDLICLCEIQGECDPETNAKIDADIKRIREKLANTDSVFA